MSSHLLFYAYFSSVNKHLNIGGTTSPQQTFTPKPTEKIFTMSLDDLPDTCGVDTPSQIVQGKVDKTKSYLYKAFIFLTFPK